MGIPLWRHRKDGHCLCDLSDSRLEDTGLIAVLGRPTLSLRVSAWGDLGVGLLHLILVLMEAILGHHQGAKSKLLSPTHQGSSSSPSTTPPCLLNK